MSEHTDTRPSTHIHITAMTWAVVGKYGRTYIIVSMHFREFFRFVLSLCESVGLDLSVTDSYPYHIYVKHLQLHNTWARKE
ncbi:hypothetical protein K491DRAFT_65680 [Lophiostoma macrostomum CBS 122681]|uniref:Uncharacterized protein n=1 Tax=Lophiostoma macrostomum CBS 122681 TaxID=1314788 RepID=A0A6A6T0Z6_9PLEO|nr:hypothetical protein K491DRAFT_65680 [Lophiostoma macrostomum CBS 122681]